MTTTAQLGGSYIGVELSADLAAEYKRLKAAVYPLVTAAVAENPGQKDALIRLLGLADKHDKATEYASAIATYQELSALLASLPAAGSSAPQTAVATQKPAPAPPAQAPPHPV